VTTFDDFCEILRAYRAAFRAGFVAAVRLLLLTLFAILNVDPGSSAYVISLVNLAVLGVFFAGLGIVYLACDLGRKK